MKLLKFATAVIALTTFSLIGSSTAQATPVTAPTVSDEYYQPYITKTGSNFTPSATANSTSLGKITATSAIQSTKANAEIYAEFKPKTRAWVVNMKLEDQGKMVTKTRQEAVYNWVRIGNDKGLSYEGQVLDGDPSLWYYHPNVRHSSYFRGYLWAGNNTTSNGYGAHNQIQSDGTDTYSWMARSCFSSLIFTPKYDYADWGSYRGGFRDAAINPYGSGFSGNQARGGIVGGDPLMRWWGAQGYGWYYDCYSMTTDRWQQTGTKTVSYQEWEPKMVWVDRGSYQDFPRQYNPSAVSGGKKEINLSSTALYCKPATGDAIKIKELAQGAERSAMKITVTGPNTAGAWPISADVKRFTNAPTGTNKDLRARVKLTTAADANVLSNTVIPAGCYGKQEVKITLPGSGGGDKNSENGMSPS